MSTLPDKAVELEKRGPAAETSDEILVREFRDDFKHFKDYWRENRDEMETDMRFAGANAFSPDEQAFREGLSRPCETPDELSQYVKQTNNSLRQNKRDSQITPSSEDANRDDAQKREAVLRGLNHRGNFQACFQTAFECCTWSGFGFFGISLKHTDRTKKHLEPRPRRFANQFAVLPDPYAKEADFSDQKKCFVLDIMRQSDFAREWPNAKKTSFSADDAKIAPEWVLGEEIVTAEAWRVKPDGKVIQYITNGLEILETNAWVGSWIPVIVIPGEEIYITEGGRTKRKYMSLIRRARTPQKMLAFIASQELEEFGQAPRAPFIGYRGQFTSPDWATINTNPKPYIEVEAVPDPLDPQKVLPLPQRPQYMPNAQAYELAREAWRRAVQAAIGVMPMPTAAQRQNEKSGKALEKIQNQEATGSYHFTDNADRALVNYGRQMNELIAKGMTGDRHVGTKDQEGKHGLMYLTTSAKGMPDGITDPKQVLFTDKGEYDVALIVGPTKESEHEEASDFVDTLVENLKGLPIPPPIATKILALAIQLKNVGPKGDAIAKLLDPEEGDPMQQAQKLMAQAQQQQQAMEEMKAELQKLNLEKLAKTQELQAKANLQQIDNTLTLELAKLADRTKIIVAMLGAKSKASVVEAQTDAEKELALLEDDAERHMHGADQAHELALQKDQQGHEQEMQQSQQDAAAVSQDSAQGHEADQAVQAQEAQAAAPQAE